MTLINRVLDEAVIATLEEHLAHGGGRGLDAARRLGPEGIVALVEASGLRGRGGAGFPTGRKWRTVASLASTTTRTPVVVNAAEGEPGTFKDRTILRRNPFKVLEGALIAAAAVDAVEVVVALKSSSVLEAQRVRDAVAVARAGGWLDGIAVRLVEGPASYLYGEETALLEVVEGRPPFPRVTPPYRRGLDEGELAAANSAATVDLAGGDTGVAPALVDNVETLANLPGILAEGADWFRRVGTAESPGTIVCTITGATARHGVGEVPMGTPLRAVIDAVGGGAETGHVLTGAVSGTANALLPAELFDTPLTYEAMAAVGSGLGTGGFIVFDERTDPVAVVQAVSRFLAVESCGQCEPCKDDGLRLAELLDRVRRSEATERDLHDIERRVGNVAVGARCALARQQEAVVGDLLRRFADPVAGHVTGRIGPAASELIVPIVDIVDGRAVLDHALARKQPDWTYDAVDSGASPAAKWEDHTVDELPTPPASAGDEERAPSGQSVTDAFARTAALRRTIRAELAALGDEPDRARLDEVAASVTVYVDVMERVVYPWLERIADDVGVDVAWDADVDARAALGGARGLGRGRGDVAADVTSLRDAVERQFAEDEQRVEPILREGLHEERQRSLADAIAEALASTTTGPSGTGRRTR